MPTPLNPEDALLDAALALSPAERPAYLDQACANNPPLRQLIQALLRAHEHALRSRDSKSASPAAATLVLPPGEKPGDHIGRYKLLQQIGEGGWGVVYMAEQEDPVHRRVALKVIKPGMDTKQVLARFEAERQALALMDHPNIAKVHDGGATDNGRPYFVMELVRGIKITDYCDQNNLPTAKRLELFIQVCKAIQHAHQKGIIHRDIKPSNILVTLHDGVPVPKVIDFGIAKATEQRLTDKTLFTALEQFIGTPAYMSPEQAEMSGLDIDTRSDIYSLGVLLYELLTGQTPFDPKEMEAAGLDGIRRLIREKDPPKPSTRLSSLTAAEQTTVARCRQVEPPKLIDLVRGDLDWIVMKCLEKDRTRRYETANGLAREVERFLSDEPVTARPPSGLYKLQKVVRRHRFFVAAAGAVSAALVFGLVASTWEAIRAKRAEREQSRLRDAAQRSQANESRLRQEAENERKVAQTQATKSQEVARFLETMLQGVGPSVALGRDTTMLREILDDTAVRVGTDLTNQPAVELELRLILGETYELLGLYHQAEEMAAGAVQLGLWRLGRESVPLASALDLLGWAQWRLGEYTQAETVVRQALAMRTKLLGSEHPALADSLQKLAHILASQERYVESAEAALQALALRRKAYGAQHRTVAISLGDLANVLWRGGHARQAEPYAREAVALHRKLLGNECYETSTALNKLAMILETLGHLAEAEGLMREALAIQRKLLDRKHPELPFSLRILGRILAKEGNLPEAEATYREALAILGNIPGDTETAVSADLAATLDEWGLSLRDSGRLTEAEPVFNDELHILRAQPASDPAQLAGALTHLALTFLFERRFEEAEPLLRESLAIRKDTAPDDWRFFNNQSQLGGCLLERGNYAQAELLLLSGYEGMHQRAAAIADPLRPRLKEALQRLTQLYTAWHKPEQAAEWQQKLAEFTAHDPPPALRDGGGAISK
jgi:serine/threonine protein kinase/tetratricopeptide (TPR) repeat protein